MTSPSIQRLTEQLGHLIALSRIIDRNRDDSFFGETRGEIVYVFDTNVVQMFLEPYKNPQFCEVFHKSYWGSDRENDRDVNSQACLLAAEYLMSGKLPGQASEGIWHMTRGHKAELDRQEAHLKQQVSEHVKRMRDEPTFRDEVLEDVAKLNAALNIDPAGDRSALELLVEQLSPRASSMNEFKNLTERQFRQRAAGIRAREVCRILARDHVAEPANQLFRYRSGEIAGRYMPLESFLRLSPADQKAVDAEVAEWRELLAEILSRRSHHNKTREGFRADCEALGLISWAGRQPRHRSRRIVMVTGDAIMLEAYRLRHVEDPMRYPYLVRPISHFAPLFNPVSAQSVLSSQQYAFLKLQEVIEVVLVDLNIQLLIAADTRLRARDRFVLEVEQSIEAATDRIASAFPQADDHTWLRGQQNKLESLVQALRPTERLMLEAFPNLVAPRLKAERMHFVEASGQGGEALLNAIEERLQAAGKIGAQFSLQTMPDTLTSLFETFSKEHGEHERRATVHVRLSFGPSEDQIGYEGVVEQLRQLPYDDRRKELDRLKGQPAKIFALAALLAFRLEIWKDAARYAELAATASDELAMTETKIEAPPAEHYEYLYLMAASQRFQLAALVPSASSAYADPWSEWLNSADAALCSCITFHETKRQLSRAMRARSELAAIHLAYCEWIAFSLLGSPGHLPDPLERATKSFTVVARELRACEDALSATRTHAHVADTGSNGPSQRLLDIVQLQFRSNVHAATLTARRLQQLWPDNKAITDAAAQLPVPNFDDEWTDGPLIARLYRAAVRGQSAEVRAFDPASFRLPLDQTVHAGLRQLTANDPNPVSSG